MTDEKKDTQDFDSEEDKTSTEETQENENELDSKTLLIQKKKMREQRDEAREALSKAKEELVNKSKDDDSSALKTKEKPTEMDKRLSKIEFAQMHPTIDSKVLTDVLEVAEAKGIKAEEALELPMFKAYLKSLEDEKEIADATPNSNRSPKIKPDKPIGDMTRDEHKALWEKSQGK